MKSIDLSSIADLKEVYAAVHGIYPMFSREIAFCNPLNSSPYVTDYKSFTAAHSFNASRKLLIKSLDDCLLEARTCGVRPSFLLVGGSFLRFTAIPKDLDLVCFYTAAKDFDCDRLKSLQSQFKVQCLDIRFLPCDSDSWFVAKLVGFFAILYSTEKRTGDSKHGVLIVRLGKVCG